MEWVAFGGLVLVNLAWLWYLRGRDERDRQERWGALPVPPKPARERVFDDIARPLESVEDEPDELELVGSIQPAPPEDLNA